MAKESWGDYIPYNEQPGVKRKNTLILVLTGVLVLFLVIMGSNFSVTSGNAKKQVTQNQSTTTSKTEVKVPTECSTIRTDITMLRTSFSQGKDTPQQVSWLLEAAGNDFSREASNSNGAKAAWLDKMSELSKKVSSYIIQGSPSDGPQALDQLFANMNLVNQFCD